MEVRDVLEEAEKYMKNNKAADWHTYNYFKNLATNNYDKEIKNYDEFILKLTKILKL